MARSEGGDEKPAQKRDVKAKPARTKSKTDILADAPAATKAAEKTESDLPERASEKVAVDGDAAKAAVKRTRVIPGANPGADPPAVVPARRLTDAAKAAINDMVKAGVPLGEALKRAASWETFIAPPQEPVAGKFGGRMEGPGRPRVQRAAEGDKERDEDDEDEREEESDDDGPAGADVEAADGDDGADEDAAPKVVAKGAKGKAPAKGKKVAKGPKISKRPNLEEGEEEDSEPAADLDLEDDFGGFSDD